MQEYSTPSKGPERTMRGADSSASSAEVEAAEEDPAEPGRVARALAERGAVAGTPISVSSAKSAWEIGGRWWGRLVSVAMKVGGWRRLQEVAEIPEGGGEILGEITRLLGDLIARLDALDSNGPAHPRDEPQVHHHLAVPRSDVEESRVRAEVPQQAPVRVVQVLRGGATAVHGGGAPVRDG